MPHVLAAGRKYVCANKNGACTVRSEKDGLDTCCAQAAPSVGPIQKNPLQCIPQAKAGQSNVCALPPGNPTMKGINVAYMLDGNKIVVEMDPPADAGTGVGGTGVR